MDTLNFYSNFKSICESYGMTPKEAAKENGIGRNTLAAWKRGATPRKETIIKLSEYFDVPAASFLHTKGSTTRQISETLSAVEMEEEQVRLSELFLIRWENIFSKTTGSYVNPSVITEADVEALAQFRKYIMCYRNQLSVKKEAAHFTDFEYDDRLIRINDILFSPGLTVAEATHFLRLVKKAQTYNPCAENSNGGSECPPKTIL